MKIGSSPTSITSTSILEVDVIAGDKVVVTKIDSKVGIGTISPTNKLHVIAASDPLKLEGVQNGAGTPLIIDANGVVKKQATLVRLSVGMSAASDQISSGIYRAIPFDVITTSDGNFSTSTHLYTVPTAGIYVISGVFDANVRTPTGKLKLGYMAKVNGNLFQLNTINYDDAQANTILEQRLSGTLTIKLNAGDTIGMGTISCNCPGEYYGMPGLMMNMTIVKLD